MRCTLRHWLTPWITDFLDAYQRVEWESRQWLANNPRRPDWGLWGLVVLACVVLSWLNYYGGSSDFALLTGPLSLFVDDAPARIRTTFQLADTARLARLMYWSGCTFLGYLVLPALYTRFILKQRLMDMGLGLKGALKHWWIYVGLYALVMPAVYLVSRTDSFQRTYPFYEHAGRSLQDFLLWEATYALQFLSLEFFFRGVLIHATKHRLGVYSILLSLIPYCMIHFGKPMPETLGAILAGIALGFLSLYTRSIWLGVAIHVSVAVSMDILSLLAQGKLHF